MNSTFKNKFKKEDCYVDTFYNKIMTTTAHRSESICPK